MFEKIENRPDYPELDISSSKAIIDWYHSLGPMTKVVRDDEYQPGFGQVPVGELFHAASRLYLYSVGNTEYATDPSQEAKTRAGRNLMRLVKASDYKKRIIDNQENALEVGIMLMEVGEAMKVKNDPFREVAATIFESIMVDPRLVKGADGIGGILKYESIRYWQDIKTQQIRDRIVLHELTHDDATEEYQTLGLEHVHAFLKMSDPNSGASNGELYEHFIEIITRYQIWKNNDIENLAIRSAKPRQDCPKPKALRDGDGKKLAFDSVVIDLKSGKEFPIQAKLDSWAGVREYSKLVTVVDTLDETTNGEQRKYMSKIISEVKACYNSRGNQAQQEDVDAEFEKIISGLSINN